MFDGNLQRVGLTAFEVVSLASFILLIIRSFAKDIVETVAVCFQAWRRLKRVNGRSKSP
jgi:hypothetical protein